MNNVCYDSELVAPTKIVCIGRNYAAHIEELGNSRPAQMVIFCKPNSAITTHIRLKNDPIDYEGEISFICRSGKFAGIGFGLDLTKRALQDDLRKRGLPWERSKAFDGSALFSEFKPIDEIPEEVFLQLEINGTRVQDSSSKLMLFPPQSILRGISEFITLEDNDIVMTGTPAGVGQINSGDVLKGSITCQSELVVSHSWKAE